MNELHGRLLDDVKKYDPTAHMRGLLAPYRDVLLLQRAKFMSYEQIAARLTGHGLKVSTAAVGVFCRRHFTKAEIERTRQKLARGDKPTPPAPAAPTFGVSAAGPSLSGKGQKGPKIARDDY
ncbi:MAG: hypothetical protein H7A44_08590 [Opitutaceae bacterium]|nr:hypothetical protein [Cephaloticoccus sp.]MCP5530488.1 hypothetical protein [Opitutaceae bacterium]